MLSRLHILHEMQTGFDLLNSGSKDFSSKENNFHDLLKVFEDNYSWDRRLELTSPSINHRSLLFAVRRAILASTVSVENEPAKRVNDKIRKHQYANSWLGLSQTLRQLGRLDAARLAVRNSANCGLELHTVIMEEARLLQDAGQVLLIISTFPYAIFSSKYILG